MDKLEHQVAAALERAARDIDPEPIPRYAVARGLARRRRKRALVAMPAAVLLVVGLLGLVQRGSNPTTNVTSIDAPSTTIETPSTTLTDANETTTSLTAIIAAEPATSPSTTARSNAPVSFPPVPYSCPTPLTTWTAPTPTDRVTKVRAAGGVVFVHGPPANSELWWMNADGGDRTQLLEAGGSNWSPDISSDGTRVVWDHDGQITVLDLRTGSIRRLTNCGVSLTTSEWSPDGTKILFSECTCRGDMPNLLVMNADGSNAYFLKYGGPDLPTAPISSGSWSPDGSRIVLAASDGLYIHDLTTRHTTRIFDQRTGSPAWSPINDTVAFYAIDPPGGQLWSIQSDGTRGAPITSSSDRKCLGAVWLHDGSRIVCYESDPEGGESYLVSVLPDGSGRTRLSPDSQADTDPGT